MADITSLRMTRGPSLAVAIVVALGLIVVGVALAIYSERQADAQNTRAVTVQARILAASVAAPLAFDDDQTASEYVAALRANPELEAAGVYRLDGRLSAGWVRDGAPLPTLGQPGAGAPVDRLIVTAPVAQAATPLGSVYLRAIKEPWPRRVARYSGIGLLIVMAAFLVAGLGAANASLGQAQGRVRREAAERLKAEAALRLSQEMEALAQLEAATERGRAALRQSEAQMEFALRAGGLGSWTGDLRTDIYTVSEIFRAHFGLGADAAVNARDDLVARLHPDDQAEQLRRLEAAVAQRTVLETEFRVVTAEGGIRWVQVRGRADYAEDGTPLRMAGVSMDVTERKAADDRQRLLLDELNHRVKNTLAAVQSIALQTGRAAEQAGGFESAFIARINALARVHDLLTKVAWEGASLAEVVAQTLAPYQALAGEDRAGCAGPEVRLGPNAAVTLAMAFHELATNAAKYGALSTSAGRVDVGWAIDIEDERNVLDISWTESGGPPAEPPARRGFGTQFLQRALAREFDGQVNLWFTSTGLFCRIRLPLSAKLSLAA